MQKKKPKTNKQQKQKIWDYLGRCKWCETSIYPPPRPQRPTVPHTLRGRNGNSPISAADLTERGGYRPVILMDYGISRGSRVMFMQQTHHFLHDGR